MSRKTTRAKRDRAPVRQPEPEPRTPDLLDWLVEAPLLAVLALSPVLTGAYQPGTTPAPGAAYRALWPYVMNGLVLLSFLASARRDLSRREREPALIAWPYIAGMLFVTLNAATLFTTVSYSASANEAVRVAIALILMWLLGRATFNSVHTLQRVTVAIVAGATLPALIGAQQYITNVLVLDNKAWRTFGTFATPNSLAGHLILVIPLTFSGLLVSSDRKLKLLVALALLTQLGCLVVTFSKAGFLSLMLASGVYLVMATGGTLQRRVGFATACIATLVILALAAPPLRQRFLASFTTENHSWMFRWYTWVGSARAFTDNWVAGTGAGTFPSAYVRYALTDFTRNAHNSFLQIAMECGILALLAFLALLVGCICRGRTTANLAPTSLRGRVLQGALAGITASCLHNVFDYDWYIFPTHLTFFALLGLCAGSPTTGQPSLAAPRHRAMAMLALGVLLTVGVVRAGTARYYYESGHELARGGNVSLARAMFTKAIRFDARSPLYLGAWLEITGGNLDELRQQYARLFALDRAAADPHLRLAVRLADLGETQAAMHECREALKRFPNFTPAMIELAALAQQEGDEAVAQEMLKRLAQLEHAPYGRYKAMPERPNLEFLYAHAGLAELGQPKYARPAEEFARDYLKLYDQLSNEYQRMFPEDPALVRELLRTRGYLPERVRQVQIILAWLLWERGGAQNREEARTLNARTVDRLERGEWSGLLVETALDRRIGGIG